MKFVDMKCSNCGGRMEYADGHYKCSYCGAIMLKIIDAKIDADVERLDAEEFERRLEESKRSFLIKVEDGVKVLDAKTAIINQRLQNAKKSLSQRQYTAVFSDLTGVPLDLPSAARLRFLASVNVRDEYELSLCKKDVRNRSYNEFMACCKDEETKRSYQKIAQICLLNEELDKELEEQLHSIREMMQLGLKEDALVYAKQVCSKYPQLCKSWAELASVKCQLFPKYDCTPDFEIMKKCPDYDIGYVPQIMLTRLDTLQKETELTRANRELFKTSQKSLKRMYSLIFAALLLSCVGSVAAYLGGRGDIFWQTFLGMDLSYLGLIFAVIFHLIMASARRKCRGALAAALQIRPILRETNEKFERYVRRMKTVHVILALAAVILLVVGSALLMLMNL